MNKRVIPTFATEAEEADWWFEHADELSEDFVTAAADGSLGRGSIIQRLGLKSNVIFLPRTDADLAHHQADQIGVTYEEYVQKLVHEALIQRAS